MTGAEDASTEPERRVHARAEREGTPLVETVAALRREVADGEASARLRAVIEQAKGILVQRHGISLDEAFARLKELSQKHNVRLVEVAATVVGIALPADSTPAGSDLGPPLGSDSSATSPAWSALRNRADVRGRSAAAVFHSLASSIDGPSEGGRLLVALTTPLGADAALLYRVAPDGALRLVAWHGYPEDMIKAWESIPPGIDLPVTRAVARSETITHADHGDRARQFPALAPLHAGSQATACAAVTDGDRVTGALVVGWAEPRQLDEATVRAVEHVAGAAGPVLIRQSTLADRDLLWLHSVLDVLFDPWLLLAPVAGPTGVPTDFDVVGVSGLVPDGPEILGRRILALWPALAFTGVFDDLVEVEQAGGVRDETLLEGRAVGLPLSGGPTRLRLIKVGSWVVLHWKPSSGQALT